MAVTKNIAIIPARGGSKRIPRKNIKEFLGKPIIAYSIQAALESNLFDEVIVSTDDAEIAEIAKQLGAKVPFTRSKEASDDFATLADVLIEALNWYKEKGIEINKVCCILATAPFVTSIKLVESNMLFIENEFDSLLPVVEFPFPIQRSLVKNKNGFIQMANPEYLNTRSQDLEIHYHDAGQFYWISASALLNNHSLLAKRSGVIHLSQLEVQDIDTIDDWKNAEIKYKILNDKKSTH